MTIRPRLCVVLSLVILTLAAVPAWPDIYSWQDASGRQRFSDRPPGNRDYERWTPPENPNSDLQFPEPRDWPTERDEDDDEAREKSSSEKRESRREARCREYEQELERVNNQLRAGYREPRGNRLRARRRELRSKEFWECR